MIRMTRALAHIMYLVWDLYDPYDTALAHMLHQVWELYDMYDTALTHMFTNLVCNWYDLYDTALVQHLVTPNITDMYCRIHGRLVSLFCDHGLDFREIYLQQI